VNVGQFSLLAVLVLAAAGLVAALAAPAGSAEAEPAKEAQRARLAVVWSSGDPVVAHQMVLMYTHAAGRNEWFDEVRLVVWGASAKLLAEDEQLQAKVKKMMADGIKVQACIVCARNLGAAEKLRRMGIEVKAMGKPLTDYLRGGWHVMTY
jgi:hypothetical protein